MKEEYRYKRITIRLNEAEYTAVVTTAKKCTLRISDYVRQCILHCHPKEAFSPEETELLKEVSEIRKDIMNFGSALKMVLAGKTPAQRTAMLVEGQPLAWWREKMRNALSYIDNLVKK